MRQNLGWAVGYNLIGIPLAAGAAVSGVSHSADAVGGGGGDGDEQRVRAGKQLAAERVAGGAGSNRLTS